MARLTYDIPLLRSRALLLSAVTLILLALGSTAFAFTFTSFDVPGAAATYAMGINGHGQVVGFYVDAQGAAHGFLAVP